MSNLTQIKTPMLKTYGSTRMTKTRSKIRRHGGKGRKVLLWILAIAVLCLALYGVLIKPWFLRWGATDEEIQMALPGDEIVYEPRSTYTRAITIHAPAEEVWPWIVPELQNLQVGDTIYLHPQRSEKVMLVEPGQALLLQAGDPASLETDLENFFYSSWLFYLQAVDSTTTRLIVRSRADYAGVMNWLVNAIVEPGNFIMEQKMMREIRDRAEAAYAGKSQ